MKALRGSGSGPESLGTTGPFPWARGAGAGRWVLQPRARRRHGADALPAERGSGEPPARGPHVLRAQRPAQSEAASSPPPAPRAARAGQRAGWAGWAGWARGHQARAAPHADPPGHPRGQRGVFLLPLGVCVSRCPTAFLLPRTGAPGASGVAAGLRIASANRRPPAAAGPAWMALRGCRAALPAVSGSQDYGRRAGANPFPCTPSCPRLSAPPRRRCFPAVAVPPARQRTAASPSLRAGEGGRGEASRGGKPLGARFAVPDSLIPETGSHPRAQLPGRCSPGTQSEREV